MKYDPLETSIIMEELKLSEKTPGGIITSPKQQRPAVLFGKVLCVGPKVKSVKVGDIVISNKGKLISFETIKTFVWVANDEAAILTKVILEEGEDITGSQALNNPAIIE